MLRSKSQRFLIHLLSILALLGPSSPAGSAETAAGARRAFLNRFSSTRLSTIPDRLKGHDFAEVPRAYEFKQSASSSLARLPNVYSRPLEYVNNQSDSLSGGQMPGHHDNSAHEGDHHDIGHLRHWAIFTRCVIRSFYIQRFQADQVPGETIPLNLAADPLCPADPSVYLSQAEAFSRHFFGI